MVIIFLLMSLAAAAFIGQAAIQDATRHDHRALIPAGIAVILILLCLLCLRGIRKLNARLRDQ